MEEYIYFIIFGIAILIVIIIYFHTKKWSRRISVNLNKEKDIQKLIAFLFLFNKKQTFLNIILSPHHLTELTNNYSFSLPQSFSSSNIAGGFRVMFDIQNQGKSIHNYFIEPNKIKGHFEVLHQPGPELGWFTILLKPV